MIMDAVETKSIFSQLALVGRQIRSARTILISLLLKTHGTSLIEVEATASSHPLTTDLLSDVNSLIPLSPINLLML